MEPKRRIEIRDIIEHFNRMPKVTQEALDEYTNRMGYAPFSPGDYQDFLYQLGHDERMAAILPPIMAILAKFQPIPTVASEEARKKALATNDDLATDICVLFEKYEIQMREVDMITDALAGNLSAVLNSAKTRSENMMAQVATHLINREFGENVTVKTLGEGYRTIADAKARELPQAPVHPKPIPPEANGK